MSSSARVSIEELDLVVYGQVQYDFVLGDKAGYSLSGVLTPCCAARAVAMEHEISMLSDVVRKRTKKLEDLGNAMAYVSYIIGSLTWAEATETQKYPDKGADGQKDVKVSDIGKLVEPYDLTYTNEKGEVIHINKLVVGASSISKNDAEIVQSTLKLAIDKENNAVKQDANTLQGFVDKRDDAYELIGKLEDKFNHTAKTAIGSMGN